MVSIRSLKNIVFVCFEAEAQIHIIGVKLQISLQITDFSLTMQKNRKEKGVF